MNQGLWHLHHLLQGRSWLSRAAAQDSAVRSWEPAAGSSGQGAARQEPHMVQAARGTRAPAEAMHHESLAGALCGKSRGQWG